MMKFLKPRPRCAGKILPARKPHPLPHPHTAPWNRTGPNVSPQIFPTTTTSKFVACFFVDYCIAKSFSVAAFFFSREEFSFLAGK